MPPSTKGKMDMYFGFGFLLNDSERGLREVGMKIKMSGTALAKNHKSLRVITTFDNCMTLGEAMFLALFTAGLICVCPLILRAGVYFYFFSS